MIKRRAFIRKSFGVTTGLAVGGLGVSGLGSCNFPVGEGLEYKKDWPTDPEWLGGDDRLVKGGNRSSKPGPMDELLLKDYSPRSSVVTQVSDIPKARFPAIDVHSHRFPEHADPNHAEEEIAKWVETQKEVGIDKTIIQTAAVGDYFDRLVDLYLKPYPDQFQLFCGLEYRRIDAPDYPERAAQELERCYKMGARGVGELRDKGFGITEDPTLSSKERLHPNDARLDPFWRKAAELDMPISLHMADHPSAWTPPDKFQERNPSYQKFNKYGGNGETYEEILALLPDLLKKHPKTIFIACHLANLGNDLGRLSGLMDQFPKLYLDISARDYEIGRTPVGSKKFIEQHQNRILFGTDMGMGKDMYRHWWRILESNDEYIQGRIWWRLYGLHLSEDSLKAIYRDNAMRILNWN